MSEKIWSDDAWEDSLYWRTQDKKKKVYVFVVTAVDVLISLCLCNQLPAPLSFSASLSVLALYFLYSAAALSTACLWLTLPFPCNSCSPLIVRIRPRCSAQSFMDITCSRSAWRSAKSRYPEKQADALREAPFRSGSSSPPLPLSARAAFRQMWSIL